jgi:murein DD-endopeptidase MepM/ murein hydrolase activator NlpD
MRLLLVLAIVLTSAVGLPLAASAATWPLDPRPVVVRPFDPPDSPWGAGHRGVDLLGRPGAAVRAAAAGRVSYAARLAGRGVVVVDHGALRTTYEPVSATVHAGQQVAEGAVLGRLQLGLSHCFPRACLHWGLLRGESYLDPLTLVGVGPVRLWPLDGRPAARASPLGFAALLRPADGPAGMPRAVVPW